MMRGIGAYVRYEKRDRIQADRLQIRLLRYLPLFLLTVSAGIASAVEPAAAQSQPSPRPAGTSQSGETPSPDGPVVYRTEVVARYPHDTRAYTQGLLWHDGALYESTGRVGQSRIRKVDLHTGEAIAESRYPADQFGEGLALWDDELISLTWRDGVVHRWSLDDLSPISAAEDFPFEGWGITSMDEGLIFSDGSSTLRVIDPDTYEVRREIAVTIKGRPLRKLNELEWIDGLIWANIWQTPYIAAIDPADGRVRKLIDASVIVAEIGPRTRDDVLNGIAWDAEARRYFVTGKFWPTLFEIELVETQARVR